MKKTAILSFLILVLLFPTGLDAQDYNDYIGAGHSNGVSVTTSSNSENTNGVNTINGFGLDQHFKDASRFLGQATLGADMELIEEVSQMGFENWIDAQYGLPVSSLTDTTVMIFEDFYDQMLDIWTVEELQDAGNIFRHSFYTRMAWWHNIMMGQDLLRHRVATALSEIYVISDKSDLSTDGVGMSDFYDVLYNNAFGNVQNLITDVTYHPAMGYYLSHMNNEKTDESVNQHPDENYAREVMQLFSIGLFEMNIDGSYILDEDELPIATYNHDFITEYAKIFTGLGPAGYYSIFEDLSDVPVQWGAPFNTIPIVDTSEPMVMFEEWHEPGEKFLLNGMVVPDGQSGDEDLADAIESLFMHQNAAPFFCKQLIQKLIKSNPSPEYIERVANVFVDNGDGVRGDMKAIVKAILMDEEARDCSWIDDSQNGKLREPLVRYSHLVRALNASNESGKLWNIGYFFYELTGQALMASPSVFNFYLPYYTPPGPIEEEGLVGPEFQMLSAVNSLNYVNLIYSALLSDYYMDVITEIDPENIGAFSLELDLNNYVTLDLSSEFELASDIPALIDHLDLLFCAGTMSDESKATIVETTELFWLDENIAVKVAIFLTLISPDYNIQK